MAISETHKIPFFQPSFSENTSGGIYKLMNSNRMKYALKEKSLKSFIWLILAEIFDQKVQLQELNSQ